MFLDALSADRNPRLASMRFLMNRWSCSMMLFRYGDLRQRQRRSSSADRVSGAVSARMRKSRMDPIDSGAPNRSKRSAFQGRLWNGNQGPQAPVLRWGSPVGARNAAKYCHLLTPYFLHWHEMSFGIKFLCATVVKSSGTSEKGNKCVLLRSAEVKVGAVPRQGLVVHYRVSSKLVRDT